jgi:signal transduction histidine kinase
MTVESGIKTVWLRRKMPKLALDDPAILFKSIETTYELYLEQSLIYRFWSFNSDSLDMFRGFGANLINLPRGYSEKMLFVRIHSSRWNRLGISRDVSIGSRANQILRLLGQQADVFILGLFYVIIGSFFLFIFFKEIHTALFYSFGHFALFAGLYQIAQSKILLLYWPMLTAEAYALEVSSLLLIPVGLLLFIEQHFRGTTQLVIAWLRKIHLSFAIISILLGFVNLVNLANAVIPFQIILAINAIMLCIVALRDMAVRKRRFIAFSVSIIVLSAVTLHDIAGATGYVNIWHNLIPYALLMFMIVVAYSMQRKIAFHIAAIDEEKSRLREAEYRAAAAELQAQVAEARSLAVRSEKMAALGKLTAGIAHEIKNPLNFVKNFAEVSTEMCGELEQEVASSKGVTSRIRELTMTIADNCHRIAEHAKRADAIIKGMLLHARGNSGEKVLTPLNEFIDQYVRLAFHAFRSQDSSFNVTLDCQYDPAVGSVPIIPEDMSRVVVNICNNAFYATTLKKNRIGGEFDPRVIVSTKQNNNTVEICIRDNGDGIPDEIREKIFHPFFTTKDHRDGTGLGLSISYDIVANIHAGKLFVNSEPGEFAEFIVELKSR